MRYRRSLIIILLIVTAGRLLYIAYSPFDLSPDEAHYWEWSRRLDLSYYSKGPLVAYIIAFFTGVLGDTGFAVRAGAVVFSSLSYYLIYLLGSRLFDDEKVGFYSALLANIVPLFSLGSILMTTDVLLIFFWAASALCVKKALDEEAKWWYAAGIISGLGFLAKYTMAFIFPSVLLLLLFSGKERRWLKRPGPYLAAFLALIVSAPVILWNIRNGQVTIRHTLAQAHVGTGSLSLYPVLEFLGSQAGLLTPFIYIGVIYGVWVAGRRGLREGRSGLLFSAAAAAPVFLFFFFKGFHGKVQANWAVASYVTGLPAAVWAFGELYGRAARGRRFLKGIAVFSVAIAAAATALIHYPWAAEPFGAKKLIEGPPYNRIIGWSELGRLASEIKNEMDKEGDTFIISDTYQVTSLLAMYMEGNPVTYNIDTGSRRMNQYDLWPGFEGLTGQNALYVKGGDAEIEPFVRDAFDDCGKKVLTIRHRGEPYSEFTVFTCYNFKGMRKEEGEKRY